MAVKSRAATKQRGLSSTPANCMCMAKLYHAILVASLKHGKDGVVHLTASDVVQCILSRVMLSVRRLLSQQTSGIGTDSLLEESLLSTEGGGQEAEHQESFEQGLTLSEQSQAATQVQPDVFAQTRRRGKAGVSPECSGNDHVTDGVALSRLEPLPEDFVFVDSRECTCQTSAVPHCAVRTSWLCCVCVCDLCRSHGYALLYSVYFIYVFIEVWATD